MASLIWSDKFYTLSDLTEKLKLSSCLVKSKDQMCMELDYFEVLCFKHIYCVRAFKVSTPDDRDVKEDSKDKNSDQYTLTSGDEVFIPLHYAGRGTIVPLYGESHVCNTVEELVMTFPRYVLIEEDLKICSDSKMVQLEAGSELELLRNSKDKHCQNKLICRYGDQTLHLNHSDIGRFRVRPDPNHYSVKDILQRLKLPQIIDFKEMVPDQWEKEVNVFEGLAPEQNYTGKFLLTGLFKDKVAVVVTLGTNCRRISHPFLLPLSSDLLQELTFRFAFRGDYSKIHFKDRNNSLTELDNQKDQKKTTKKKETILKRGKSEAVDNGFTEPEEDQQDVFSGDEDISPSQQIPFELTYTQYRFPQAAKRDPKHGNTIFKKFHSALKTVTGKFKKASSKDVAAISTPEPIRMANTKIYPILANLMNEDSSVYDYIESGTKGKKNGKRRSQSQSQEEEDEKEKEKEKEKEEEVEEEEGEYMNVAKIRRATRIETITGTNVYEQAYVPDVDETDVYEPEVDETEVYGPEVDETEVYDPDVDETKVYAKADGNETEKDIGSLADSEENIYMNYNQMATLQIRRRSEPPRRRTSDVFENSSSEDLGRDSNRNTAPSTRQSGADEKSDVSTEDERSYTESGCSSVNTDMGDYERDVTCAIPNETYPIPVKRTSLSVSGAYCSISERSSDASSDMSTGGASNEYREQTTPLEAMSVVELCESFQLCGLSRISKLCSEHSLDGAFICSLPNDSLQEPPFALTSLEVIKLSMMKKGWKPKMK